MVLGLLVDLVIYLYRIIWDYRPIEHAKTLGCDIARAHRPRPYMLNINKPHTPHAHTNLYPKPIPHLRESRPWVNGLTKGFLIDCFVLG